MWPRVCRSARPPFPLLPLPSTLPCRPLLAATHRPPDPWLPRPGLAGRLPSKMPLPTRKATGPSRPTLSLRRLPGLSPPSPVTSPLLAQQVLRRVGHTQGLGLGTRPWSLPPSRHLALGLGLGLPAPVRLRLGWEPPLREAGGRGAAADKPLSAHKGRTVPGSRW